MRILYNTQGKSDKNETIIEKSNSLTNGSFIFSYTQIQNLNTIDLSSLETGVGMFWNSNLSTSTQDDIAKTIKNHTDGNTHVIDLGNNVDSSIVNTVEDRGWTVTMYELKADAGDKYSGCLTPDDIKVVDGEYLINDIENGVWNEPLLDLSNGWYMFDNCTTLTTINSNLPNLRSGDWMFRKCSALTSFSSDLINIEYANDMFFSCENLTSFNSDLSSLRIGHNMFFGCNILTEFNCNNLSRLEDGRSMFAFCENLTSFNYDLPNLTSGEKMFQGCTNLTSFKSDLSSLKDGYWMFNRCSLDAPSVKNIALTINKSVRNNPQIDLGIDSSIVNDAEVKKNIALIKHKGWQVWVNSNRVEDDSTDFKYSGCLNVDEVKDIDSNYITDIESGIWNEPLPDLTDGESMFYECTALTTFNSNLPYLNNGKDMFSKCSNLTSFDSHLFRLTNGESMFYECTALTAFNSVLNSLEDGQNMFYGCSNLTEFTSELYCLNNGHNMFLGCCLGRKTVQNIAKTIKTFSVNDGERHDIHIGINISLKNDVKVNTALKEIRNKGWNVEVSYNVKPNTIKYALCTKPLDVSTLEPNYKTVDVINGIWSEPLPKLQDCNSEENQKGMFQENADLVSFNTDLSSLTNGQKMFYSCSNLTRFNGDLSSLEDGSQMFDNCSKLSSFASDLCSLKNGKRMFYVCTALTSFTSELHNLNDGSNMFYDCSNLTTFTSDLPSLTNGYCMFRGCSALESFSVDLPSLTIGERMFYRCIAFTSFNSDLSSLKNGYGMFGYCENLTSFTSDLSSLTNGKDMFRYCSSLTSFSSDLSSLTDGSHMFYRCSNLTSFTSNLSSLTDGEGMFSNCELNAESIQHIADTINDLKSQGETGKIHIDYADDVPSIILYESGEKLTNKGWTVYFKGVNWEQQEYGPYDVVKKNGYIPDASKWNDEIYIPNNLIITEITVKGDMINNE